MRVRRSSSSGQDKVELQMTPMIDVVFQLLTFFVFSFKIVSPEGDFQIKMPVPGTASKPAEDQLPISIRLKADAGGTLAGIMMNEKPIGSFKQLHDELAALVGSDTGPSSMAEKSEVELNCDYDLDYRHVVEAITAISGSVDNEGHIVKLIQKIKFAPPKKPGA